MRYFKFSFILLFVCIFLFAVGCAQYNKDGVYHYKSLQDAISDVNNECVGKGSLNNQNNSGVVVILKNGTTTVRLLRDETISREILLNNTNLDLNGFLLTNNKTTIIKTYGVCHIYNGSLYRSCDNEFYCVSISRGSTCYIENIELKTESLNKTNIAVYVYGEMFLSNSTIEALSLDSNQKSFTAAIYGNIFSKVHIERSNIIAKADFGRVDGMYIGNVGFVSDSHVTAYANYQSNEKDFTSCAIGCNNSGTLTINNCNVYGVHSGINSHGALFINGGTYSGYGHGGIYCAGIGSTNRVTNATILQAEMPIGYEDMGVGCMQGGLYIGGGKNKNNISVFVDGCVIKATKNPIVLRGTSGEQNNSLYISNTILDVRHIRVDNDTHCVYIGEGCNFERSHVDIPNVVVYTNIGYAEP